MQFRSHSKFANFLNNVSLSFGPGPYPGINVAINCHVSLNSFKLEHFFSLSLSFRSLTALKRTDLTSYRMTLNLDSSDVSSGPDLGLYSQQEQH